MQQREVRGEVRESWTTEELQQEFTVDGFALGMVVVVRKSDGVRGTLNFVHSPRLYYDFQEA